MKTKKAARVAIVFSAFMAACGSGRAETPKMFVCRFHPVGSVADIGVHMTKTLTVNGRSTIVKTPSPDGPWTGQTRISLSLDPLVVSQDGVIRPSSDGPSAVTWQVRASTGMPDVYAIDRQNGDFYHSKGDTIVDGGMCQGLAVPF